jgi:hypothetical protein
MAAFGLGAQIPQFGLGAPATSQPATFFPPAQSGPSFPNLQTTPLTATQPTLFASQAATPFTATQPTLFASQAATPFTATQPTLFASQAATPFTATQPTLFASQAATPFTANLFPGSGATAPSAASTNPSFSLFAPTSGSSAALPNPLGFQNNVGFAGMLQPQQPQQPPPPSQQSVVKDDPTVARMVSMHALLTHYFVPASPFVYLETATFHQCSIDLVVAK